MAKITTRERDDGTLDLELTYGGADSPFGGIDTSAPPAYIDPTCFANSDGFVVTDNRLVLVSLAQVQNPVLFGGVLGITVIGAGTFFNSLLGQLNYVLGYTAVPFGVLGTSPTGVQYIFYITSWAPSSPGAPFNDTLGIDLYNSSTSATQASLQLTALESGVLRQNGGTGGTGTVTVTSTVLTSFTQVIGGTGYNVGDYVNVLQGDNGSGFIQVTSIGGGGAITGATIANGGDAYTAGGVILGTVFDISRTQLTINGPDGGPFSYGFIANGVVNNTQAEVISSMVSAINGPSMGSGTVTTSGGALVSFTVVNGGRGHFVGEVLTVTQGSDSTGEIQVTGITWLGVITTAGINTPGTGYANAPVTFLNPVAGDPNVTASASTDGLSLILTANADIIGAAGNSISVQDTSSNTTNSTLAPCFYFPVRILTYLEGGLNSAVIGAPISFTQASIAEVGGTIYIGGIGPMILQFSGSGSFKVTTMYCGVSVLRKFAGALVGLGIIPQLGEIVQNSDMIYVWSAPELLGEWSPVDVNGNVTGAGFNQLADIGDALRGMIVSNNTAFIIRQQGVGYASSTGNGTEPFSWAVISLGDSGEGTQSPALISQYDQMGVYVGSSNIFSLTQGIQPIGNKIKNAFFSFLSSLPDPIPATIATLNEYLMGSASCACFLGGTEEVYFAFMLSSSIYIFNATNQTWVKISYVQPAAPLELTQAILSVLSNSALTTRAQSYRQSLLSLVESSYNTGSSTQQVPVLYSLIDGLSNVSQSISPYVIFPVEEILFGRDVTIDGFLIALNAYIPNGTLIIDFFVSGVFYGALILIAADFTTPLIGVVNPVIQKVFTPNFSAGDPQFSIQISSTSTAICQLWVSKIAAFGSMDPMQRPV